MPTSRLARVGILGLLTAGVIAGGLEFASADAGDDATTTPIKHVVVLFQENTSFDHYFGTYPNAANKPGDVRFTAAAGTPSIDGLTPALLTANPNRGTPTRLGPADVVPKIGCANNHSYTPEQNAFDGGLMDKFVENTQGGACGPSGVLDYFDGNTVTGLWNYAQHFAMSDHFHGTGFGPSTIGAIELVSGDTSTGTTTYGGGAHPSAGTIAGAVDNGTVYSNLNPPKAYDACSTSTGNYALDADTGGGRAKNVGDLLNTSHVSWGWFQAGFTPTNKPGDPIACGASHTNVAGALQGDYDPHHNPFAYYASTANPNHVASNTGLIGEQDNANHQYDQTVFDAAVKAGNLPAVSFVKAGHYQDGHPGNSDPIDEQTHLVNTINEIEASPDWASTAIIIAWDDSDGWYDHQAPTITRTSSTPEDTLTGSGKCGALPGQKTAPVSDTPARCGFGPRLPFLVISPYAKQNYVDHDETDQTSILRFIEDNWSLGRIGGGSVDVNAKSIAGMFDFTGSTRAAPLTLDASTGALPGTARVPAPAPTPTPAPGPGAPPAATPVPAPVITPNPTVVLPPGLGKLTCTGKLSGSKKVVLSCKVKASVKQKSSVRARLLLKKKLLGTASTTVKAGKTKLTITIKTKAKVKRGKYTLTLGITTVGSATTAQTGTLKL